VITEAEKAALCNLCSLTNIIRAIKRSEMHRTCDVQTKFRLKSLKERDLGIDGRIILKWISTNSGMQVWAGFM
jgi:hypothetical protein